MWLLSGWGVSRADDLKVDSMMPSKDLAGSISSGEKQLSAGQGIKARIGEKRMRSSQVQTRSQEMKISTDVSTPEFTSRQREMKITTDTSTPKFTSRQNEMAITDQGATRIREPKFTSSQKISRSSSSSGLEQKSLGGTSDLGNMKLNYMGKIMEGRVDFVVNRQDTY